jgi:hypothetical protein
MNLPIQSQPVIRQYSTVAIQNGIYAQDCSAWDWLKCGAIAAGCAVACVLTEGEACIACMGPVYDSCKQCL